MGWNSAGRIFDPVAEALIETNASEETTRKVLGSLIEVLQGDDWDTEQESLNVFRDDPVIVDIFYRYDVTTECDDRNGFGPMTACTLRLGHEGVHKECVTHFWPNTSQA